LNRASLTIILLLAACLILLSCGSSNPSTSSNTVTSGLKFRAFITNPLNPASGGGGTPVVNIVDAAKDVLSPAFIALASSGLADAGMMALSPNSQFSLIYSPSSNNLLVVSNSAESVASISGTTALSPVALPATTESFFFWIDNRTAFVALPSAPVTGQSPGLVDRIDTGTASITAKIPIAGARYVFGSHNGNRILALSEATGTVTVIAPSLIGDPTQSPLTPVCCFDHPAGAVFSADDSTAYILECGPECGGTTAAVTLLDLSTNTITQSIPVDGATAALISGSTLYVAGTPPTPMGGNTCTGTTTAATNCGRLDVVNLSSNAVTSSAVITDGYHSLMQLGGNGQLFIGATNCTNITQSSGSTGEVRGCLSIFNTSSSAVVVPPQNGDVTGIAPITSRSIVYVCQNGGFFIYDTTTDMLKVFPSNMQAPSIIGRAVDVKLVDPGPPPQ
jgi:hypothetical protein